MNSGSSKVERPSYPITGIKGVKIESELLLIFFAPLAMLLCSALLKAILPRTRDAAAGTALLCPIKSQEHWDYARHTAPGIFLSRGAVLLALQYLLCVLTLLLRADVYLSACIGGAAGLLFVFFAFARTEGASGKSAAEEG